jgi:putative ABC transport system permease protein
MGGLALGLASSFLLLLYAQRELTVDRHFQNADRIHRIATDFFNMGGFAVSQEVLHEYLITECKDMDQEKTIQTFPVDENYITALGMQLIAGRNFSRQMDSDTTAAIINETAARELGLHAPLDAEINPGMRVIGVVRDFHYESLRNGITPVVLRYSPHGGSLAVKLKGADLSAFINELQAIWKGFSPDAPLHYSFLDESFAQLLEKEKILGRAVAFFTLLAIIISCLGLFALAVFTAESRTKEIGIRKVLGAGIGRIVALLSRDFIKLVLVAACLGLPIAWLAMNRWLEDFAFRIEIQWWMLVLPCMTALAVALLTVSSQAVKAAMADPVRSLRDQ